MEFNVKTSGAHSTYPTNRFMTTGDNKKMDSLGYLRLSVLVISLRLLDCSIAGRDSKE